MSNKRKRRKKEASETHRKIFPSGSRRHFLQSFLVLERPAGPEKPLYSGFKSAFPSWRVGRATQATDEVSASSFLYKEEETRVGRLLSSLEVEDSRDMSSFFFLCLIGMVSGEFVDEISSTMSMWSTSDVSGTGHGAYLTTPWDPQRGCSVSECLPSSWRLEEF